MTLRILRPSGVGWQKCAGRKIWGLSGVVAGLSERVLKAGQRFVAIDSTVLQRFR